jgi:DNA ligase-1
MLLAELVRTSLGVAATRSRNGKRDLLAALLAKLAPSEIGVGVSYLSGRLPQGRVGVGPAALRKAARVAPANSATLEIADVVAAVDAVAATTGKGSSAGRERKLAALFGAALPDEQRFLVMLLVGELRQGALDGVMIEALAKASGCASGELRRAFMLSGDLASVARAALLEGPGALARFRLTLGTPLQSMLAQTADTIEDALSALQRAVLDYKMDGARVQVHKSGADVAVFSRRLNDVSASIPEVLEVVRALPVDTALLDGEAIALDPAGRPRPFQTTMRRFGRKLEVAALREALPIDVFFFDCLHADGEDLLERPLAERLGVMDSFASAHTMPRLETSDSGAAAAFLDAAIASGHEGVMAKDPASPYVAGSRGSAWLKVKSTHTLDLVILAAEWGHGRRRGRLSNLHLGARDEATGQYVMLGKTFKGLSDAMLEWQTETLLAIEVAREGHVVFVEPRVVAEIAFNEVQASPQYPGGLALRFARVKAYREDKRPEDADTLESVREIHARTHRA